MIWLSFFSARALRLLQGVLGFLSQFVQAKHNGIPQ